MNRQPAGIPTGGQFSESARGESSVDLSPSQLYSEAGSGALDHMLSEMDSTDGPPPRVVREISDQTDRFIEENRELLDSVRDDGDESGDWIVGRDIALARNSRRGTEGYKTAFAWVADLDDAETLRSAARDMGPLRLTQGLDQLDLNQADLTDYQSHSEHTSPERLAEIAEIGYADDRYMYWTRVQVATNPHTPTEALDRIAEEEAEDDFRHAIATNPNASTKALTWASKDHSTRTLKAVIANPKTPSDAISDVKDRLTEDLVHETKEAYGVSPMQGYHQSRVRDITDLLARIDSREKA